jgi:hypothetical protein
MCLRISERVRFKAGERDRGREREEEEVLGHRFHLRQVVPSRQGRMEAILRRAL